MREPRIFARFASVQRPLPIGSPARIDDGVDWRVRGELIEAGDQRDRRRQHLGLRGVADQRDDVVPCPAEARGKAAADEAGGASDQHGLAAGELLDEPVRGHASHAAEPAHRRKVPDAAERCTDCAGSGGDAEQALIHDTHAERLHRPIDQHRQQQHQDGAIVDREQRVVNPLARRQLAAQILLDEIHQRDDDLGDQDCHDQDRQHAVNLQPAEQQEQQRIEHVADAVQLQLETLRRAPRQALGEFVVIESVEHAHHDLDGDEGPQQRRHDTASLKTADWWISAP